MKTPDQFLTDVHRRLTNTWHTDLTGQTTSWPHTFPLGEMPRATLENDFAAMQRLVHAWHDWAAPRHVTLTTANRRVHGTTQAIPTHATVATADHAAALTGEPWPARLARGHARAAVLASRYPHVLNPAAVLRAVDTYTDSDFDLLCTVADWFATHDASGLTHRQVPLEGIHAKWLNTHQPLLCILTGRDRLGLLPAHPSRIHFTYLDPGYRASGRRQHDSATVGDLFTPAYPPRTIIISENKDTAMHFPPVPGGIAVEGVGKGGGTIASFPWITACPRLFYWGDLDADGFEILNEFRQAGVPAVSILMDIATYDMYARYGTATDASGRALDAAPRKPLPFLTVSEQALYERVTDPVWNGPRRLEQERIPLDSAVQALQS